MKMLKDEKVSTVVCFGGTVLRLVFWVGFLNLI